MTLNMYHLLCSTLYQIWAKSNNLRLSYVRPPSWIWVEVDFYKVAAYGHPELTSM